MYLEIISHPDAPSSASSDWIDVGVSLSRSAVRQADAAVAAVEGDDSANAKVVRKTAARAYQWLGIFIGLLANSPNTPIAQRIQLGHEFNVRYSTMLSLYFLLEIRSQVLLLASFVPHLKQCIFSLCVSVAQW